MKNLQIRVGRPSGFLKQFLLKMIAQVLDEKEKDSK
jgi:hypothetical protein